MKFTLEHLRRLHWNLKKKTRFKSYNVLSKFTTLDWAIAILGYMWAQAVKLEKQTCLYHRIIGKVRGIVILTGLRTMI